MEKLDPKSIENIFALTPLQEGMLFHYLRSPHSELYFEQLSLEISGTIDIQVFQKTWHLIIETNEMLRTVFRWERLEKPSQIILKEPPFELRFHDLSDMGNDRKKTALAEMKTKDREEGFDLNRVPFRVTLCKLDECQYEMIISNHHILYDGWSNGIILKEFFKIYQTLFKKEQVRKFPAKPSFKEYIKWLQNLDRNTQEQYWRGYLSGLETLTELPIKKRAEEKTGPGDYSIILEEDINGKLNIFVKNNKVTLASVFYTAWGILLQKYCDSGDVIFGTTVSGRSGGISGIKGIEDMVGLFINTIPLRIQAAPNEKIIEVVFRTDQVLREQEKFENTPLVDIRTYSTVDGTGSMFDTILAIENYPLDNRLLPENSLLAVNSYSIAEMTHYDLSVGIMPFHEIEIKFSFKQELFDKETIENLAGHFKRIIQNIIENPETRLSQLEIISTEEKNRILYEFNNTAAEYPADKTIHQLFEEQAAKTPAQIALVGHIGLASPVRLVQLTYRQLNEQSNRVAGLLIEKGVLADNVVAIMMERSIEMIIGIFGILKSGGAYLPIDPDYPQERKQYMIKDSAAKILLTANEIASLSRECVFNSHHSLFINHHSYLSYLIYTSGSTGKPKGVMIRHRSVANLLYAMQSQYPFTGADVYLLKTSYTFDVSVTELFGWYLGGGKLAILEKNGERDPDVIFDWIHRHHITHINFVPSMFSEFVSQLDSKNINRLSGLKYIFLAGEALLPEFVNKFRELNTSIRLENIYGPTESSVYSSKYSLAGWNGSGNIPIGRPMPNIRLYIFDKYDHLQPPGIVGELSIAGIGVARGYLNRPELTAEKFRPLMTLMPQMTLMKNKYNALRADFQHSAFINQHSNLYCTGDLARWLPDGNIQFLGRIDNQVKIRGFRIELGEIENRLLKHNRVKTAAVIVTDGNIPHLRAYIVLKNEEPGAIEKNPGAAEFREYLAQRLPVYMIPAHFFLVEKIPLTPHGKVDSKALQAANTLLGPGVEYVSP
ncbi:MAG TPA: amino acid adenylation domain-containing protein, partial [Candidatus Deferrimicrobium sp.]|nr:amino acid adenylation domain-containing protein [Candidatus Deferrimicrobium sp.]